jgi:hypothetical protein
VNPEDLVLDRIPARAGQGCSRGRRSRPPRWPAAGGRSQGEWDSCRVVNDQHASRPMREQLGAVGEDDTDTAVRARRVVPSYLRCFVDELSSRLVGNQDCGAAWIDQDGPRCDVIALSQARSASGSPPAAVVSQSPWMTYRLSQWRSRPCRSLADPPDQTQRPLLSVPGMGQLGRRASGRVCGRRLLRLRGRALDWYRILTAGPTATAIADALQDGVSRRSRGSVNGNVH